MNYFLNYVNQAITVDTFRKPAATVTTVENIEYFFLNNSKEDLTADLTDWIKESGGDLEDDNLERLFEGSFGFYMYDYPELRDIQRDCHDE